MNSLRLYNMRVASSNCSVRNNCYELKSIFGFNKRTPCNASLTYNIDYENPDVQNFIRRYRAMFNTEPTQFAYQGYDVTKYFVGLIAKYQNDWMYYLKNEDAEMLQSSFLFRTNGQGGFLNNGIRRIIYGKDYSIEEVL